ncbi:MAG: hypothetical protein U9O24_04950 [Campylobacterota bacterium]|nr:hypothetical protein [Campylobacterota bacterium]
MIDMRSVFTHTNYSSTVDKFKLSDCNWSIFQDVHKDVSNNKCPICEVELSTQPSSQYLATIDHFRPKATDMYPDLRCEPKNYILMCKLCNEKYKKSKFPLYDETKRVCSAKCINDVKDEKPLLFNLIEEDPLYFFELVFKQTAIGGILELKRNSKTIAKDKTDYNYMRCQEMIDLFGLGNCHKDIHPNKEIKECRIDILTKHYIIFIDLAKARGNKKSLALFLKDENRINELKKYGFFQFIMKNQFVIT